MKGPLEAVGGAGPPEGDALIVRKGDSHWVPGTLSSITEGTPRIPRLMAHDCPARSPEAAPADTGVSREGER